LNATPEDTLNFAPTSTPPSNPKYFRRRATDQHHRHCHFHRRRHRFHRFRQRDRQSRATHFTVAAPTPVTPHVPFNFTVTALDAYGNTATGYAGTVHFSSNDPAATLPPNSP